MMKIGRELSESLRIASLIAIVGIMAIHYHTQPFPGSYTVNYVIQEFIHNVFARAAVPAFALMSGLLFFQGEAFSIAIFGRKLAKRIHTVLLPTLLVTATLWIWMQFESSYLNHNPMHWDIKQMLVSWVFYPPGSQFWFIRDLLILFCLTPYIYLLVTRFGALLPLALLVTWSFDWQLFPRWEGGYFLYNDTVTFFVLGAYLSLKGNAAVIHKALQPRPLVAIALVIVYLSIASLRIYLEPNMSLWYNPVFQWHTLILQKSLILLGMYLLFSSAYVLRRTRLKQALFKLSGFSFFFFLVHDYPLKNILWDKLMNLGVSATWIFYVRFAVALVLLILVALLLERLFPRFFGWLCGGRNVAPEIKPMVAGDPVVALER